MKCTFKQHMFASAPGERVSSFDFASILPFQLMHVGSSNHNWLQLSAIATFDQHQENMYRLLTNNITQVSTRNLLTLL